MSRTAESGHNSTLRADATTAVLLFGCTTVLDRLAEGVWSLGRPLIFAIVIAAVGPISQAFAGARTRARWAARRASEPTDSRTRREHHVLIGVLAVTVIALVVGIVLIRQDLTAGRSIFASAWVALALLAVAVVFLAEGIHKRRAALRSITTA
ncbi:MAG: hypothetical protein WKF57_13665 [Nakamurella sp.]